MILMLRKTLFIIALLMMALVGCTVVTTTEEFTLSIELNPGVDTVEVNSVFEDAGATAYLNGNTYDQVVISQSTLDITRVGSYSIVYQTSYGGQTKEVTRYVDVIDETPPVVTLKPGIDTIPLKGDWVDAGINAYDNSELDVQINIRGGVVDSQVGEYLITYTVTDAYGNQAVITRYVHVIDNR